MLGDLPCLTCKDNATNLSGRILYITLSCIQLDDPEIKAYYYFLGWMLPKFTTVNTYFQSETVVITKLNSKMTTLYK